MVKKLLFILSTIVITTIVINACTKDKNVEEKKMVLYSAHKDLIIDKVVGQFEENTGIEVEVIIAGTGELMARLKTEAENPAADVFWGGAMNNFLPTLDLFEEYSSPNLSNSVEGFNTAVGGKITPTSIIPSVIIVNKKALKEITGTDEMIDGYQSIIDLAKKYPALKGRISNANPSKSSSAYEQLVNQVWAFAYVEAEKDLGRKATVDEITQQYIDSAWPHVAELVAVYDGKHSAGSSAAIADVIQGETAIGLTHEGGAIEAVINSEDIIMIYPVEGAVVKPVGVGIIKGAVHQANAQKFVDYLISPENQNSIKEVYRRPVMKNADLSGSVIQPITSFRIIFDNADLNNKQVFIEKYNELFRQ